MKKTLSIILAILMIVTTIPMAFAADVVKSGTIGPVSWTLDSNGVVTVSGEGSMGYVSSSPFDQSTKSSIKKVIIEDGVTDVGNYFFASCSNLTYVYIADSVTKIGNFSFAECLALKEVYIGSGIKEIGSRAFYSSSYNYNATAWVVHYNGTQEMWNSVSVDSSNQIDVHYSLEKGETVPATCVDAGYTVLSCAECGCSFETEIVPATGVHTRVNDICTVCGDGCDHTYENGVCTNCSTKCKHAWRASYSTTCDICGAICGALSDGFIWMYNASTGCLEISGKGTMPSTNSGYGKPWSSYSNNITSIVIGEGITSISESAFSGLSRVTSISIPSTVTTIGKSVYSGSNLVSVVVPGKVTSMDNGAFYYGTIIHYLGKEGNLGLVGTSPSRPTIHYCEATAAVDATCTADGVSEAWYCATCDKKVAGGEVIPASHTIVKVEAKAPTCTEIGWDAYEYCTACDYTTYAEKAALDHDIVIDEAVAATCTETGLTAGQHCSRCDAMTIAQEVVPALNHKDTLVEVDAKAPTCTEIGWDAYEYCTACDYSTYTEKAALNHKDTLVQVEAKAPTCTEIGWDAYEYCTACDYSTYTEKAALNHKDTLVQVEAKAPTCTEIGWDAYEYCTACDYTTYAEKAALDHDIVIDEAVAATCTETGLTAGQHCSRCDDMTIAQEVIPDLGGHINEDGNTTCDRCGEQLTCEDCGRPVHAEEGLSQYICWLITLIKMIVSFFK